MKRVLYACALLLGARDAGAKCAMQSLTFEIVTHQGDAFPSGGGVLVAWTSTTDGSSASNDADPTWHEAWQFREKRRTVKTERVKLAPGLTVYRPMFAAGRAHAVKLVDGKSLKLGTFTRSKATGTPPAAPTVTKVTRAEAPEAYRAKRIEITAQLGAAPPAGAFALVILDEHGTAESWGRVDDPSATSITVYRSEGHCGVLPPDMRAAAAGDHVTFEWVGKDGEVSAASSALEVE
jgi:hypothetical protein